MNIVDKMSEEHAIADYLSDENTKVLIESFGVNGYAQVEYETYYDTSARTIKSSSTNDVIVCDYLILLTLFDIYKSNRTSSHDIDELILYILTGCIMFSLMLQYVIFLQEKYPEIFSNNSIEKQTIDGQLYYIANTNALTNLEIIYTHYQLISVYNPNDFIEFYTKHRDVFNKVSDFYESENPETALELQRLVLSGGSDIKRTLATKVKKMNAGGSNNDTINEMASINDKEIYSRIDPKTGIKIVYQDSDPVHFEQDMPKKPVTPRNRETKLKNINHSIFNIIKSPSLPLEK
jgi:hypothetical protein